MPTLSPRATEQIAAHQLFETAALCMGALMQRHYPGYLSIETPQDVVDALAHISDYPPVSGDLPANLRVRLGRYTDGMTRPTAGDYPARCVGFLLGEIAGLAEGLPGAPDWPITSDTVQAAIVADPRWTDVAPRITALVGEDGETDPDELFHSLYVIGERAYDEDAPDDDPVVDAAADLRLDGGYGRDFVARWYEDAGRVLP